VLAASFNSTTNCCPSPHTTRQASGGDKELWYALNQKVYKELSNGERRKLKREKWDAQDRKYAECGKPMELRTRASWIGFRCNVTGMCCRGFGLQLNSAEF
jgi:hypothetical protein